MLGIFNASGLGYPHFRIKPKPVVLRAWSVLHNSYLWMHLAFLASSTYFCCILCSWNVFVYDHETFNFTNNFFIYFIFRKLTCLFTYLHMNLLLQNKFNVNNEIFLFGFSYDSSLSNFDKCEIIL